MSVEERTLVRALASQSGRQSQKCRYRLGRDRHPPPGQRAGSGRPDARHPALFAGAEAASAHGGTLVRRFHGRESRVT